MQIKLFITAANICLVDINVAKEDRQTKSNTKNLIIAFFDPQGIVHGEFIPPGCHCNFLFPLECLEEAFRKNIADLYTTMGKKNFASPHNVSIPSLFWQRNGNSRAPPGTRYIHLLYKLRYIFFCRSKLWLHIKGRDDTNDVDSDVTRRNYIKTTLAYSFHKNLRWLYGRTFFPGESRTLWTYSICIRVKLRTLNQ